MRMVVCFVVAGVLCVSRGISECAWLPRVGGRGLAVRSRIRYLGPWI